MSDDLINATWTFYDAFTAFPLSSLGPRRDGDSCVAEVQISLDAKDGGTHGEFSVRWYRFDRSKDDAYAKLEVFGDAWKILPDSGVVEVLARLGNDDARLTPEAFMAELRALGFIDRTEKLNSNLEICPTCYSHGLFKGDPEIVRWRTRIAAEPPSEARTS